MLSLLIYALRLLAECVHKLSMNARLNEAKKTGIAQRPAEHTAVCPAELGKEGRYGSSGPGGDSLKNSTRGEEMEKQQVDRGQAPSGEG